MKSIKISFYTIFNIGYGFLTFYILPVLILIAFNRTKGAGNNPDGEIFMPFAWLLLLLIPVLLFYLNKIFIKKFNFNNKFFAIAAGAFLIGAVIAVLLINANYSINYIYLYRLFFNK